MQAMIVSPSPGPRAFKPKSGNETQSGSESSFAPTLNQAIQDRSSTKNQPSKHSHTSPSSKSRTHTKDDLKNSDVTEDTVAPHLGAEERNSNQPSSDKTTTQGHEIASAAQEASELFKDGEARLTSVPKGEGKPIAKQTVSSAVLAAHVDKAQLKSESIQQESASVTQPLSKTSKESSVTAQFAQNPSLISNEQDLTKHPQNNKNAVYLQANDSITWDQSKTSSSNMPLQNTAMQKFNLEDSTIDNSSAIRVERFNSPSALISQKATENADQNLPLSVERIAARLTDIPAQTNTAGPSLRDNTPSLRQDTHEQFVEAKLEYIDKKQHSQTDQQSMNSDSESTQKNALAAASKNIDKPSETSFSQSFQSLSADKSVSAGVDTMRPGGSAFTPQIHENHILHQVLHKFRISQHLQDQKLVLKLHPAELGDLKIDVHMKDGTINTNILAQSQQVQDILEKNMPRLKALMEEQGLVVNEITIKLDTDVSDNNHMFEDHLAQDDRSFSKKKNMVSSKQFELHHEDSEEVEFVAQPAPSGVNVMI